MEPVSLARSIAAGRVLFGLLMLFVPNRALAVPAAAVGWTAASSLGR